MLAGLLAAAGRAGARLLTSCIAEAIELAGGRVAAVRTSRGRIETRAVIDASGAWAGTLARASGLEAPAFRPLRRHIFESPTRRADADGPFVWDLERGAYFRPDGDRTLLCACEEEPHPPGAPGSPPEAAVAAAAKIASAFPALASVPLGPGRGCLRTFSADRRPVLGPDPRVPGLFYAAALGGHGVTTASVIGEIVARALLEPASTPAPFATARFA
jgi:glycine/D-amino acid oxidase-like deaminating enzyme